jgi:hypothetical protein
VIGSSKLRAWRQKEARNVLIASSVCAVLCIASAGVKFSDGQYEHAVDRFFLFCFISVYWVYPAAIEYVGLTRKSSENS